MYLFLFKYVFFANFLFFLGRALNIEFWIIHLILCILYVVFYDNFIIICCSFSADLWYFPLVLKVNDYRQVKQFLLFTPLHSFLLPLPPLLSSILPSLHSFLQSFHPSTPFFNPSIPSSTPFFNPTIPPLLSSILPSLHSFLQSYHPSTPFFNPTIPLLLTSILPSLHSFL